nr:hypothetical protein [Actinomycetota bacterium]
SACLVRRVRIARAALAQMRRRGYLDARQVVFSTDRSGNLREIGRPLRLRAARRAPATAPGDCAA